MTRDGSKSMPSSVIIATALFAQSVGVEWRQITEETGLTPADMITPERRYSNEVATSLWKLILEAHPGRAMTLRMARGTPPRNFGALAFGARFARDLRQLFAVLTRFGRLTLSSTVEVELLDDPDLGGDILRLRNPGLIGRYGRAMGEMRMAGSYRYVGEDMNMNLPEIVSRITFGYEPYGPVDEYEEYFETEVVFDPSQDDWISLHFRPGAIDTPLSSQDDTIFSFVLQQLRNQYERMYSVEPLDDVREAIERSANEGDFTAEGVARQLGKSLRSVQREVNAQDTTLRSLIEEERLNRARKLLSRTDLSIGQVSEQLGYGSANSFRRAFQRGTGSTPSQYRATLTE